MVKKDLVPSQKLKPCSGKIHLQCWKICWHLLFNNRLFEIVLVEVMFLLFFLKTVSVCRIITVSVHLCITFIRPLSANVCGHLRISLFRYLSTSIWRYLRTSVCGELRTSICRHLNPSVCRHLISVACKFIEFIDMQTFEYICPGWHKVIRCLVAQIFRQKCLPKIELRIIVFSAKRDPHVWVKNAAMVTIMKSYSKVSNYLEL